MSDTLEGKRPKIDASVPLVYRNLIERCWAADPDNRPSFDSIVDEIKSNHEFITDEIDENEFFDYVDFLDNYKSTFYSMCDSQSSVENDANLPLVFIK